jgi:hypothetical protein
MHRKTVAIVVNKTESGFSLYPSVALPVPADSEPPMLLLSPLSVLSSLPGVLRVPTMLQREQSRLKALPKNLISRLPEQVRVTGQASEACSPETSVRAEDLAGDAAEQLELRTRVAARRRICGFSVRNPRRSDRGLIYPPPPVRG